MDVYRRVCVLVPQWADIPQLGGASGVIPAPCSSPSTPAHPRQTHPPSGHLEHQQGSDGGNSVEADSLLFVFSSRCWWLLMDQPIRSLKTYRKIKWPQVIMKLRGGGGVWVGVCGGKQVNSLHNKWFVRENFHWHPSHSPVESPWIQDDRMLHLNVKCAFDLCTWITTGDPEVELHRDTFWSRTFLFWNFFHLVLFLSSIWTNHPWFTFLNNNTRVDDQQMLQCDAVTLHNTGTERSRLRHALWKTTDKQEVRSYQSTLTLSAWVRVHCQHW